MLSGNGRHRRPRQAPALVVAAGVTGSAIAIPLLGATGAHAADGANWDRVAECETGGSWSQNSGNGYYGGLQLSQEVWEQYGGLEYAPSADQASRSQQIRIAENLHADQGIAAWPTCGLLAGLGNDSASTGSGTGDGASEGARTPGTSTAPEPTDATGSTGATDSSASSDSSDSSGSSGSSGSTGTSEPTAGTSPSPSSSATSDPSSSTEDEPAKSGASTESDPAESANPQQSGSSAEAATKGDETDKVEQGGGSSGRHRGDSADEGAVDGRAAESSGRHASRDEGEAREAVDGAYTVRSGDSLWGIADSLELDGGWRSLYAGNKEVVGADPDHILPGQTLTVTGESGEK